jgi:hypothetical protein
MKSAAFSILTFGAYLAAGGLMLLIFPAQTCHLMSLSPPQGPWIRITGMLMLILSFYCWRAAREDNAAFIRWSLYTRPTTIVFLIWFAAAGWIQPIVIVFGVLDVLATAWTLLAMRREDAMSHIDESPSKTICQLHGH